MSLQQAAREILEQYAGVRTSSLVSLGNHGGFSGARLWRAETISGDICVRAWPHGKIDTNRLSYIHSLMRKASSAGLAFVPAVRETRSGRTWVEHAGRLWDVTTWKPGTADFRQHPTEARLAAACRGLAQLHIAWADAAAPVTPCPAVQRRLQCHAEWTTLLAGGWRPDFETTLLAQVRPIAERAWQKLPPMIDAVPAMLELWKTCPLPVQPCLCDICHDHVLFEQDTVTGIIDYGSAKQDNVAGDLARILGSLVGNEERLLPAGIGAYHQVRPLSPEEERLIRVLDVTGLVLGVVTWLRWLYHDGRSFEDEHAVAQRMQSLVARLEDSTAHG